MDDMRCYLLFPIQIHLISECMMLVELLWRHLSSTAQGIQVKHDLPIDAKKIANGCVSKSARNFASKVESKSNYPPEV